VRESEKGESEKKGRERECDWGGGGVSWTKSLARIFIFTL
jgi:hypothetical protein